jgi:hypothetical protein
MINIEKIAHELKHAFQFLEEKIAYLVTPSGRDGDGNIKAKVTTFFNFSENEREAYNRQNEFTERYPMSTERINDIVRKKSLSDRTYFNNMSQLKSQKEDMIIQNELFMKRFNFPKMVFSGWITGDSQ